MNRNGRNGHSVCGWRVGSFLRVYMYGCVAFSHLAFSSLIASLPANLQIPIRFPQTATAALGACHSPPSKRPKRGGMKDDAKEGY